MLHSLCTQPPYSTAKPHISYACDALNNIPTVDAVFGNKDMGPFIADILRNNPQWQNYTYTMPIQAEQAGGHCAIIDSQSTPRPYANGLVTATPNHLIIGYGADCPGILASSADGTVVGMFHASWWAQADHGVKKFVAGFKHFGIAPHDIHATIGPCIAAEHYKVRLDDHFHQRIRKQNPLMLDYLDNETSCFDVRASTEGLLRDQGVTHIHHIALDTFSHTNLKGEYSFYSARRGRPANHNNPWVITTQPQ